MQDDFDKAKMFPYRFTTVDKLFLKGLLIFQYFLYVTAY